MLSRVVVTSVLLRVFALALPLVTAVIVDRVVPRADRDLLLVVSIGLGSLLVFQLVTTLVRSHLLLQLRTNLDTRLTLGFIDYLSRLPFDFFQRRSAGDLMMRVNNNATVRELLTSNTLSALLDGTLVIGYAVLILVINPLMAKGQIHGGVAQGIAQALFEEVTYGADGQPVTGTFVDYTLPAAPDLPAGAGTGAQPAPTAEPTTLPTAAPGYAAPSAGPSPITPSMMGSPTPTDRPRDGQGPGGSDTGQDGKGTGHGATPAPAPDTGGGQDPGKGDKGGKPSKPDKPGKPGPGGQNPAPAPTVPVPAVPQPDPQPDPDPPTPTLPLPDPLHDRRPILGTGPAGGGPLGLG